MGRTKQFDEAVVLRKAMLTFWEFGYEKTSVRLLEERMGINQFSIYASFQSKEELFRRVLQVYAETLEKEFLSPMMLPDCRVGHIYDFLVNFAEAIILKRIPNGCLMVYSTADLDLFDQHLHRVVTNFFGNMADHFRKAIHNSIRSKELPEDTPVGPSVEYLTGIAQSVSIYSKIRSKEEVEKYIRFALEKL